MKDTIFEYFWFIPFLLPTLLALRSRVSQSANNDNKANISGQVHPREKFDNGEEGSSQNKNERSLWKIRNLPEKMNTLGVIRFITNLNIVVNESRNLYQVVCLKSYERNGSKKVEAVMSMPDEMGKRLANHHGMEMENCCLEVTRTKACRFGIRCSDIDNCTSYHEKNEWRMNQGNYDNNNHILDQQGENVKQCWYQLSCPFGGECRYVHDKKEARKQMDGSSVIGYKKRSAGKN